MFWEPGSISFNLKKNFFLSEPKAYNWHALTHSQTDIADIDWNFDGSWCTCWIYAYKMAKTWSGYKYPDHIFAIFFHLNLDQPDESLIHAIHSSPLTSIGSLQRILIAKWCINICVYKSVAKFDSSLKWSLCFENFVNKNRAAGSLWLRLISWEGLGPLHNLTLTKQSSSCNMSSQQF